ncbi:chymotrypsin-2-like [Bradysia coprophila]|uniref:chymotrypsin-2-like n=1 Tax=Bradysia coprophila TaxID=38358 RepID=UPI00187DD981|nr:chymotrypsin-2-like [Bradysia coprophila]
MAKYMTTSLSDSTPTAVTPNKMKAVLMCLVFYLPLMLCLYGGIDVKYQSFFIVTLQDNTEHFCNGALVSSRFVLTAASCVKDKQPQDITLKVWIVTSGSTGIPMVVEEIIYKNPTGQKNVHNNIALLRLAKITEHKDELTPFELERLVDGAEENVHCSLYGWGKKSIDDLRVLDTLQMAKSQTGSLSFCKTHNSDVDETNICIYDANSGLCDLDTGGLLTSPDLCLWGIATEQHSCGNRTGDVYTRVYSHIDWIRETMKEDSNDSVNQHTPETIIVLTATHVILTIWLN